MKQCADARRRAFTLIELLVVIAIIALLAAILFPVFGRVRENARKTACASNMKQVGMGLVQYQQDYDEKMPFCVVYYNVSLSGGSQTGTTWKNLIFPYVKSTQVYVCPSNNSTNPGLYTADASTGITDISASYGASQINDNSANNGPYCGASAVPGIRNGAWPGGPIVTYYPGQEIAGNPYAAGLPLPIAAIQQPSKLIAIAEFWGRNNGYPSMGPMYQAISGTDVRGLYAGHLGMSNYLFCDGHVKALKPIATAVPYDLWDVNKQDVSCQQLVDGLTGVPGLGAVQSWYDTHVRTN